MPIADPLISLDCTLTPMSHCSVSLDCAHYRTGRIAGFRDELQTDSMKKDQMPSRFMHIYDLLRELVILVSASLGRRNRDWLSATNA